MSAPQRKPSITRARTGCTACKRMRRRCDEAKPECSLCKRRGRQCVYDPPKVLVFDGSESLKQGQTLFRPLHLDTVDDHRKLQSFQYFCEKVIPNVSSTQGELPGTQQMGGFSSWLTQHLRTSRASEPVLDYLIGALSSVHGASWRLPGTSNSVFYFDCLSKALATLTKGGLGDETVITSCIVLGICEQVRTGDLNANSPYMAIALRILHEWTQKPEQEQTDKRKRLVRGLLPALSVASEANNEAKSAAASSDFIPGSFASFQIAENALFDRIIRWVIPRAVQLVSSTDTSHTWIITAPLATVGRIFDAWTLSFRHLEQRDGPLSPKESDTIVALKAHYLTSRVMLNNFETPEQTAITPAQYDVAGIILQSIHGAALRSSRVAISYIAPLFYIATRCQHRPLRSRALAMLEQRHVEEGAWNSRVALLIAHGVIALETERRGSAASSPASARSSRSPPATAGAPKSKDQEGTPPPECPPLRLESADCFLDKTAQPPTAKVTIKYLTTGALGEQQACTKLMILKDAQDYEGCKKAQWPLDAVIKSFGYLRWNALPVPYAASDIVVKDRVITNMMYRDTRALTR